MAKLEAVSLISQNNEVDDFLRGEPPLALSQAEKYGAITSIDDEGFEISAAR